MKTKIFRIIIGIVVVCAVLAAGVWFFQTRTTAQTTTDTSGFTQTVAVQQGDLNASISVVGELDATQSQDMAFDRLANSSTLLTLSVAAGNKVQAGQILAAVDPTPYQQALDQAQSALLEAQQNLEDLQTPPTESDIAQADLAIAKAKLDVETATAALTDLQAAPDLTDLETAVQSASDNLDLAKLQDSLAQHDSIAASERDLQYAVNYHQRLVQQLQDLVAQHKANLEQTDQLAEEQDTLAEVQAELAQVQAQHRLALQSSAAQVTAAEAELADAQDALVEARAGTSELDLAKAQLTIQQANVALQAAEDARTTLDEGADEATLAAAQADVDKKQLAVSDAQADLDATQLVAPFDGTILQTNAEAGDQITASSPILTIANLNNLQVVASVDETAIRQVESGQPASITFDAFPGQTFRGQVLSVPLQGALQGGVMVYEVPISLEGAEKLSLLVGMTANAEIQTGQATDVLLVPTIALQNIGGLTQVLVPNTADPTGASVSVPVETGLSNGTYTEITKGLNPGDQVVIELSSTQSSNPFRNFGGGVGGAGGAVRFLTGGR